MKVLMYNTCSRRRNSLRCCSKVIHVQLNARVSDFIAKHPSIWLISLVSLLCFWNNSHAASQTTAATTTSIESALEIGAATTSGEGDANSVGSRISRHSLLPRFNIIGDVNDNGLFAIDDVRRLRESVITNQRLMKSRKTSDRYALADVAEPCGRLDENDADRLVAALQISTSGYELRSLCHKGTIGQPIEKRAPPPPPENLDQRFSKVAQHSVEFGGVYMQDDKLILALTETDSTTVRSARRALIGEFGEALPTTKIIEPRLVDYSFNELHNYRKRARNLFASGNVTSIDTDEIRNRVSIGLKDITLIDDLNQELDTLNIPRDVVYFFERKIFDTHSHVLLPRLQGSVNSLVAGVEVGIPLGGGQASACSLGFLAERSGSRGFVTNTHCTRANGMTGVAFNQPASSNNTVGVESIDPPVFTNGACPSGETCRFSDAAFISLSPNINGRFGAMAKSVHTVPYTGSYTLTSKNPAFCGETVNIVGRSTGETTGIVDETCCDLQANWATVANTPAVMTMLCQDTFSSAETSNGDSGAPVIVRDGYYDAKLVGVHWGGLDDIGSYSPIANIESELGSMWLTPHNVKPEVTITAPSDSTNLGSGLFHSITATASFFDFENGGGCNNCEIKWLSTKDGVLEVSPVSGGSASETLAMYGQGIRYLVAVAKDADGATSTDYIKLETSNAAPSVWITSPQNNQIVYRGWEFVLTGDSFDAELFHALPCDNLSWSTSSGGNLNSVTGCSVLGSFASNGTKTITLVGQDANDATDSSNITVTVVDPPLSGPPQATWIQPLNQVYLAPDQLSTLIAKAVDPDGSSPIRYEWWIKGSVLSGGVNAIKLGESLGSNGQHVQFQWKPGDHVPHNCGGNQIQLEVIAIDADGENDSAVINVSVLYGPC